MGGILGQASSPPHREAIYGAQQRQTPGCGVNPSSDGEGAGQSSCLAGRVSSDDRLFSSRLALQHGDGHVVDYLSQPVIDYILKSQLYINASG